MATIKYEIELEETLAQNLVLAFAAQYNWTPTIMQDGVEVENPKSAIDNWRECTARYWSDVLNSYTRAQAIKAAEESFTPVEVVLDAKSV